jgi:hypothetical protein
MPEHLEASPTTQVVRIQNPASLQISSYLDAISAIDKQVAALVEKGPSYLLLYASTALFLVAIFSRVQVAGKSVLALSSAEFIVLTLEALLLVGAGTLLRWFQYRASLAKAQEDRAFAQQVVRSTLDAATAVALPRAPADMEADQPKL